MKPVYKPYEKESWEVWEKTLDAHENRMSRDDFDAYLPSPLEVEQRKQQLRWLQENGFDENAVERVMLADDVAFKKVVAAVRDYGLVQTERRLKRLLAPRAKSSSIGENLGRGG